MFSYTHSRHGPHLSARLSRTVVEGPAMVNMTAGHAVDGQACGRRSMVRMVMTGSVCIVGLLRLLQAHALLTVVWQT